jgi:hypothetical protein
VVLVPAVIALLLVAPSAAIAVVCGLAVAIVIEAIALARLSGDAIARTIRGSEATDDVSASA